jgi:hypothetical protein
MFSWKDIRHWPIFPQTRRGEALLQSRADLAVADRSRLRSWPDPMPQPRCNEDAHVFATI